MPDENIVVTPMEDGGAEVALDPQPMPAQPAMQIPEEIINLVPLVAQVEEQVFPSYLRDEEKKNGPEILQEIGQFVVEEFDADKQSRSQWEDNTAAYLKLFMAFMNPKTRPWPNCSNICLPLLTISCLQFHARAYDALIPAKEVVKVYPVGEEDIPRAERVSRFMNYQLLYKMPNFEEEMDKSLMQLPIVGDVHRKTFYDPESGQNLSQYVPSMDVVVNYGVRDIESAQRITHILYMRKNDIRKRVNKGVYAQEAWELKEGTLANQSPIKEVSDRSQGTEDPGMTAWDMPRMFLEQHRDWDLNGDGIAEPYVITVDYETKLVVRITKNSFNGKPIDYFTHYVFFPNPEGYYGLGFGILIRHLNESANTIVNEIIDAGALANEQGGFILKRSGLKGGALTFERGEYKSIDPNVDDIRKAVWNFDFKGPNTTLYSVLGLLFEYSKLVSSVSETMTGQMPSSDTPATTVMALIEEGRKVFSTIHKRIHRSFKKELKKIYRLNALFMDEQLYFHVLGDNNAPDMAQPREQVGRADFFDTDDIVPVSDPAIISRAEKVLKAQTVVQDVRSNPLTAQNAEANFKATERLYRALDVENVQEILKPPPEPPDLSPEEENAGFFTEKPATVLPHQDHAWHLTMHKNLEQADPLFSELTPEGVKLLQQHIQATLGALYLQAKQNEQQAVQQAVMGPGAAPAAGGGMMGPQAGPRAPFSTSGMSPAQRGGVTQVMNRVGGA